MIALFMKRPILVFVICSIMLILGTLSLNYLSVELLPSVNYPKLTIITRLAGYGSDNMEREVTKKIEESIGLVSGIKQIYSSTEKGKSTVIAECNIESNIDTIVMDIWESLKKVDLPKDSDGPIIYRHNPDSFPVVVLALSSKKSEISEETIKEIKPYFERIDGISMVDVTGETKKVIRVECDSDLISSLGISMQLIISKLNQSNDQSPSGYINKNGKKSFIVAETYLKTIKQIENTIIKENQKGAYLRIKDIGKVFWDEIPNETISRINGNESITFYLIKEDGKNTVETAKKVMKAVDKLKKKFVGIDITPIYDQADYIEKAIDRVTGSIKLGMILSFIVLLIFFQTIGIPFIIALSMPLSIMFTFYFMYLKGISLNLISLSGLALGAGALVDNSIIVTESIVNKNFFNAVKEIKKVFLAVLASTFTTLVVFWPLIYVKKDLSLFYFDLVYTVSVSLLVSLFIAFICNPVFIFKISKNKTIKKSKRILDHSTKLTKFIIKNYIVIIIIGFIFIISAGYLYTKVESEYMASMEPDTFMIHVEMLTGAQQAKTIKAVNIIEKILNKNNDIKNVLSKINKWSAELTVKLVEPEKRKYDLIDLYEMLRYDLNNVPFAQVYFSAGGGAVESNSIIKIEVYGYDNNKRMKIAKKIVSKLFNNKDYFSDPAIRQRSAQNKIVVIPDRIKSYLSGFSLKDLAHAVRASITGPTATYIVNDGKEIPVMVRLKRENIDNLDKLKNLTVSATDKKRSVLNEITRISILKDNPKINKKGLRRFTLITSNCKKTMSESIKEIRKIIDKIKLPKNYYISFGEEVEKMNSSKKEMFFAIMITIILIYMILASLYESFLKPIIVMFSIPFSYAGVIYYLFITNNTLNMSVYIGSIMLAGIVVNNVILLMDEIVFNLKNDNIDYSEAVVLAVNKRSRPIIMTALTTILGLIPVCLAQGEGTVLWKIMGTTVVSGLITSTILTFVLFPAFFYSYLNIERIMLKYLKIRINR